jgi:putative ABC transport system substrate-binding protein
VKRRTFIAGLGAAAAWPLTALAQQPAHKVWRIGFLAGGSRPVPLGNPYTAFQQGMRELGYAEGKDFVMEWCFAENRTDLFPDLAVELVRLRVDVIVLGTGLAVPAVAQATKAIPIVMGAGVDPVGRGYVNSLAHPGHRNIKCV